MIKAWLDRNAGSGSQESRITSVTRNGQTVTYAYNGLDTRTSVTMGSTVNTFLRDGAYVTDPVLVDSGATYTPGISERRGTTTTYLHSGLKNAFAQSGAAQTLAAVREYDAFGNVTSGTGLWAGPFGYAGKFGYQSPSIPGTSTPDEGLQLLGHRYYDPSTGRFLTRDPIFDGRNWYSYAVNNPVTWFDYFGLMALQVAGTVAGGVTGAKVGLAVGGPAGAVAGFVVGYTLAWIGNTLGAGADEAIGGGNLNDVGQAMNSAGQGFINDPLNLVPAPKIVRFKYWFREDANGIPAKYLEEFVNEILKDSVKQKGVKANEP